MKSENKIGLQKDKNEVEIKIILVFKYIIMAIIVGIVVGIIDTIFGRGLIEISDFRNKNYKFLLPFLPIAGLFITWMYHKFNELSLKGMTLVFETRQQKRDSIPLALVPLVMVGTWITHLFGGSAGREGVAVQIGATLSHAFGKKLKMPDNSKVMLITGMAADTTYSYIFCDGSNSYRLYGLRSYASCNDRSICRFFHITYFRT